MDKASKNYRILVPNSNPDGSRRYDLWIYANAEEADGDMEGHNVIEVLEDVPSDTDADEWV